VAHHTRVDVHGRAGDRTNGQRADAEGNLGDGGVEGCLGRARQDLELAHHAALPIICKRVGLLERTIAPGGR